MQLKREDIIGDYGVYPPRRPGGELPFILFHIGNGVMEYVTNNRCLVVQVPRSLVMPRYAEVAFRNMTGYEYAPSTHEHWGVHVGNNRIVLLCRNAIL